MGPPPARATLRRGATPRQPAGHYEKWPNWTNASGQPRQAAGGLRQGPQASVWGLIARKGTVCGSHVAQNALFRYITAREAWGATPRQPAGHYGERPNWANALEQPPARLRGGLRWDLQAPAWGLIARKGAVWAEGLADGTPWTPSGCQLWATEVPGTQA